MATVYSDRGFGVRPPTVVYNRANEAAGQLKPGDLDWGAIFAEGVRWFHSGGIFASLSETTGELILEGMRAAKAAGAVVSFDLNFRDKLWAIWGGTQKAVEVLDRIIRQTDVLVGNEEDLQKALNIAGPQAASGGRLDPAAFLEMIESGAGPVSPIEGGGHDASRGSINQPPSLERCRLGGRPEPRRAHHRAGCAGPSRRR